MKDENDDKKADMEEIEQVHQERMIYNIQFNLIDTIFSIDNRV